MTVISAVWLLTLPVIIIASCHCLLLAVVEQHNGHLYWWPELVIFVSTNDLLLLSPLKLQRDCSSCCITQAQGLSCSYIWVQHCPISPGQSPLTTFILLGLSECMGHEPIHGYILWPALLGWWLLLESCGWASHDCPSSGGRSPCSESGINLTWSNHWYQTRDCNLYCDLACKTWKGTVVHVLYQSLGVGDVIVILPFIPSLQHCLCFWTIGTHNMSSARCSS